MQPKITIIASGNLFLRQMRFENVGDIELGHSHTFDHLTLIPKGILEVFIEDQEQGTTYSAPAAIKILAGVRHRLVAKEEGTLAYCIHALRDAITEDILPPNVEYGNPLPPKFNIKGDSQFFRAINQEIILEGRVTEAAPILSIKTGTPTLFNNTNLDNSPLILHSLNT